MNDGSDDDDGEPDSPRATAPKTGPRPSAPRDKAMSFLQQALGQLDDIKDAVVRTGTAGKKQLDVQLLQRQRERVLAQIGDAVVKDVEAGGHAPASLTTLLERVRAIDDDIGQAQREAAKLWGGPS